MLKFLAQRRRQDEWMDAPDADAHELDRSLRFIRTVNSCLGYTRATLQHLSTLTQMRDRSRPLRILDVATGSGDIPQAILKWADKKKLEVRIVGIDLHAQTLVAAARLNKDNRITFARADATRLPFADSAFDIVITGMFLHHLDEAVAVDVLKEMDRVALLGVVVSDLLRSHRAYAWITLFTLLANPMVKHDARVSVAGAFNRAELLALRDRAGLGYLKPKRHFGHRLILAGNKAGNPPAAVRSPGLF